MSSANRLLSSSLTSYGPFLVDMSFSFVVHDSLSLNRPGRHRLTCPRHPSVAPIPPTLLNSPHLSSPHSVFRQKSSLPKWPSQGDDEWLRDMVPLDRSSGPDADTKSESSNDSTPSPTSSDSSFGRLLLPPSPMLRPRSASPEPPTSARRAQCGSGFGQSPHT